MALPLPYLNWQCSACGHAGRFSREAVRERLGIDLTIATVATVMSEARCTRCQSSAFRVHAPDGTLLLDSDRAVPCAACGLPIPLPRLQLRPDIRLCVLCAEAADRPSAEVPWPRPPRRLLKCPRCGRAAILQRPRVGTPFVGCVSFPDCWWKADLTRADEIECFGSGGYEGWLRDGARHSRPTGPR